MITDFDELCLSPGHPPIGPPIEQDKAGRCKRSPVKGHLSLFVCGVRPVFNGAYRFRQFGLPRRARTRLVRQAKQEKGAVMQLTYAQKLEFYEKGYVRIPGVVPAVMVDAAVKAINHSFGKGIDPERMITFQAQSFCPELRQAPVICDLYNRTPVRSLAESMIGDGKIAPITGGQIAVRFPLLDDPPPALGPHLDGRHSPHNGVPAGHLRSFTMLAGIALSDVPTAYAGNLAVWPGTHRLYEEYFRAFGTDILLRGGAEGMPPIGMPEPEQMIARAGDAILVHYQVAHCAAPNVAPHPRYAIYFRLRHVNHESQRPQNLSDIWMEWDGMRAIAAQQEQGVAAVEV